MDCTACGDKCPFVQQGFCKTDSECPHYSESWWIEQDTGKQKLVKDCSPKRLLIQGNEQFNRSISVQASLEKLGNRIHNLEVLLESLIHQSHKFLVEQKEILLQLPQVEK